MNRAYKQQETRELAGIGPLFKGKEQPQQIQKVSKGVGLTRGTTKYMTTFVPCHQDAQNEETVFGCANGCIQTRSWSLIQFADAASDKGRPSQQIEALKFKWRNVWLGRLHTQPCAWVARPDVAWRQWLRSTVLGLRAPKAALNEGYHEQIELEPLRPISPGEVEGCHVMFLRMRLGRTTSSPCLQRSHTCWNT